ncbi:MAG: hypothetical protein F4077_01310 [Gammaproteobacteria bacterium]|nr:hypothetical protein [Gammaproteobacteria bacterium]MYI76394.1 hypothetical protein [Gammaproteobacteria bacterium]
MNLNYLWMPRFELGQAREWTRIRVLPHRKAQFIAFAILELLLLVRPWVRTITVDNGWNLPHTSMLPRS